MRYVMNFLVLMLLIGCETVDNGVQANQASAQSPESIAGALGLALNQSTEADVRSKLGKPDLMIRWLPSYVPTNGERYSHVYTVHSTKIQMGFNEDGVLVDVKFADNLTVVSEDFLKALSGGENEEE